MDMPADLNNLYLFLILFFPGFVSLKVYDLLIPNEKRNFSHDFLEAISYSILNLGVLVFILAPVIHFRWHESIWIFSIISFLALVIFPIIWPIFICKIQRTKWYAKWFVPPNKRAWDWFFYKDRHCG